MQEKICRNIFLKILRNISFNVPEASSLSRATSFNRHNVSLFLFKINYEDFLESYEFSPDEIWNVDENGCTTCTVAKKNCHLKKSQTIMCNSIGKARYISDCCAISSIGNTVPPMLGFPFPF